MSYSTEVVEAEVYFGKGVDRRLIGRVRINSRRTWDAFHIVSGVFAHVGISSTRHGAVAMVSRRHDKAEKEV